MYDSLARLKIPFGVSTSSPHYPLSFERLGTAPYDPKNELHERIMYEPVKSGRQIVAEYSQQELLNYTAGFMKLEFSCVEAFEATKMALKAYSDADPIAAAENSLGVFANCEAYNVLAFQGD